jgi:hypothetical protein
MAVDLQKTGYIDYCHPPQTLKCYGGGLMVVLDAWKGGGQGKVSQHNEPCSADIQELLNLGLERIMVAHRQELAEIDQQHAEELKLLAV